MTTTTPPALLKLADLSQRIDIKGFYESWGVSLSEKPSINRVDGTEWHGNCPECGGKDRFAFWQSGRFSCSIRDSGCGIHGNSPYFFLRDVKGYNHIQALEELGIDQSEIGNSDSYSQEGVKSLPLFLVKDEPPSKKWQERAHLMCHVWEKILWSEKGQTARDYLHSRGLTDETIRAAHLGLNPDWYKEELSVWGLDASQLLKEDDPQIKVPRGIVLPWYVGSSIHKIQLRRPEGGYFEILGSAECLYSLSDIEDRPVLLVESEFDALAAHQEASDIITAVATGGTPKGRNPRNLTQLHQASRILQAFDDDPAGEAGAAEWQKLIPTIERWTPWAHDVNDMLREEIGIRSWVELGLSNGEAEQGETLEEFPVVTMNGTPISREMLQRYPDLPERVLKFLADSRAGKKICCNSLEWELDVDGLLICPCVTKARNANRLLDIRIAQEIQQKLSPVALADW